MVAQAPRAADQGLLSLQYSALVQDPHDPNAFEVAIPVAPKQLKMQTARSYLATLGEESSLAWGAPVPHVVARHPQSTLDRCWPAMLQLSVIPVSRSEAAGIGPCATRRGGQAS